MATRCTALQRVATAFVRRTLQHATLCFDVVDVQEQGFLTIEDVSQFLIWRNALNDVHKSDVDYEVNVPLARRPFLHCTRSTLAHGRCTRACVVSAPGGSGPACPGVARSHMRT